MKKLIIVISLIIIVILGSVLWWNNSMSPADSSNKIYVTFVVEKGDGVREIANRLKTQGLIRSPIAFFLLVKQAGFDKKIQAGNFRLSQSMTTQEIAENLTHGIQDIWITVPEEKSGRNCRNFEGKNSFIQFILDKYACS